MDLYIRSQDKLILEKCETLQLCQNPDGTYFFNSGLVLGTYKTKQRALEVLDEIQEKLKIIMTNEAGAEYILARHLVPIIYEMPQE